MNLESYNFAGGASTSQGDAGTSDNISTTTASSSKRSPLTRGRDFDPMGLGGGGSTDSPADDGAASIYD